MVSVDEHHDRYINKTRRLHKWHFFVTKLFVTKKSIDHHNSAPEGKSRTAGSRLGTITNDSGTI
jgi:hypothetical protein